MTNKVFRRKRVNFLKLYPAIRQIMCIDKKLSKWDFNLIMYLDDIVYFTRSHFKDGIWWGDFKWNRFSKLEEAGWFVKFYKGTGRGDHSKWKLTLKARQMVTKVYKICYEEERIPLPLSLTTSGKYTHKKLTRFVKKHNEQLKERKKL